MRRAMTLVEMLTAIGVIAILIAMLLIGINFVSARAKTDKTRTMLQNLRSMMTEFEAKGGRADLIDSRYRTTSNGWSVIQRVVAPQGKVIEGSSLRDPKPFTPLGNTQVVIGTLISVPANRKIIDNLPHDSFLMQPPNPTNPGSEQAYKPPLLLDGWGNPILYAPRRATPTPADPNVVPSGPRPKDNELQWGVEGLTFRRWNESKKQWEDEPGYFLQPADGKGLWISAGPDGDFSTGDDNVYSDDSGRQSTAKK
jgi:prepilin-type N-terminal cleavage/methylation domain-containing protein